LIEVKKHRIFLAPRSSETSYKKFKSTIEYGLEYSRVEPFLDIEGKEILRHDVRLFAWGNVADKKPSWDKMKIGDYVIFYVKGAFIQSGRIKYKQMSEDMSLALWPRSKRGKTWPCIFFLEDLRRIQIDISLLAELGGYKSTWKRLQGFQPLNELGMTNIFKKYGTIENFLFGENQDILENEEELIEEENKAEQEAGKLTTQELRERAIRAITKPPKEVKTTYYSRDPNVAAHAKSRAHGICELCGQKAPFEDMKHVPYLEVHHVLMLSKGGRDSIDNTVAICPNCHRKMHILHDKSDEDKLKGKAK